MKNENIFKPMEKYMIQNKCKCIDYTNLPMVSTGSYPIRYCIASCPRSGTGYIHTILNKLGLNCGHETYFAVDKNLLHTNLPFFGDSSWLSVPFLDRLPKDAVLFHQVRDPVRTINSCITSNHTGRFENYKKDVCPEYPWFAFHHHHTLNWEWPDNTSVGMENHWWCEWHEMIEKAGIERGQYFRYKIEDLNIDLLRKIFSLLQQPFDEELAQQIVNSTPKNVNNRGTPGSLPLNEILTSRTKALAEKYGYTY